MVVVPLVSRPSALQLKATVRTPSVDGWWKRCRRVARVCRRTQKVAATTELQRVWQELDGVVDSAPPVPTTLQALADAFRQHCSSQLPSYLCDEYLASVPQHVAETASKLFTEGGSKLHELPASCTELVQGELTVNLPSERYNQRYDIMLEQAQQGR